MINKILIAIDGSKSALNAAEYAFKLAKLTKAEVEIIYVVRYSIGSIDAGVMPYDLEENEIKKAKSLIARIRANHPNMVIEDFETVGLPADEIDFMIAKWKADLLVIGDHTHRFLKKLFLGSIEDDLLKKLRIPLLIIPEEYKSEPQN